MDIDTDFSGHARKICIKHVKEKYGERSVASIMTKGTMAARKSLDYSGKLYGLKNFNEKGRFGKLVKEIKAILGDDPKASLKNEKIQEQLEASYADNEAASTIIKWATLMEGYITSYGTHAAGIIIGDGTDIENYIPLMTSTDEDGNPVFAVQADMVQCEALLGFIKMDFLGLKNLNIITDAMRMIRDNYGVTFDPYNLPFEEVIFREIFAKGDTNFVFQFESDGMKKMLKDFHPTDFKDIILLVACYRPGPMDFIPDIIHAKETGEPSEFIKRFPMLKPVLEETYGYPVYQEQVMKIMTICASFTTGMADNVRRHMSKKHEEELAKIRPDFVAGCVKNGISAEDANWLFDQLMPFAKYGFNKSHAACYATVSYITAWAKYHYFKEYICAAITTQDKKTSALKVDCEGRSVTIYRPDINESGVHFQPFKDGIICGLSSIKGTKAAAEIIVKEREENGIFTSAENFIERVKIKADNLKALVLSGAFDSFTNNREAFLDYLTEYAGIQKDIIAVEGKLADIEEKPEETEKEQKAKAKSRKETEMKLALMLDNLNSVKVGTKIALSTQKRLAYESEYLDMWVTGNPMEDYDVSDKKYIMISDIEREGKVVIPGIVTEFKLLHRKSDGANMCQFKLVDKTGNGIRCCCFVANYAKLENILKDGQVIAVTAKAELSETDTQDTNSEDPDANVEQEDVYELIVQDAVKLNAADKILTIISKDIVQKVEDIVPLIKLMASDEGYVCKVYDKTFREIQSVTTRVDAEIIERLEGLGIEYTCA